MVKKTLLKKMALLSLCAGFALLGGALGAGKAAAAEPISNAWLKEQVKTIPAEKGTQYSFYIQTLGDEYSAPVVLNSEVSHSTRTFMLT